MLSGIPPFEFAHNNDLRFQYIINGRLLELIKLWKLEENIPKDALDLLFEIFKPEKERITMQQILNHPYFVKSRQLMVSTKNTKKQETTLPITSSLPSTTIKATMTLTTEIQHPYQQQLQQQIQLQQWTKSNTLSSDKQQKPLALFSKISNNSCNTNHSNKNRQQYKISMLTDQPPQQKILL
jgi:hypothetical protein